MGRDSTTTRWENSYPLIQIIPANQGVQGWDRYAFVNNNPTRYIDPSGHKACADQDEKGGCVTDLDWQRDKSGRRQDRDKLTEGGKRARDFYLRARDNPGWWNDNEMGTLTIAQFLGIYLLFEAGGYDQTLPWIKDCHRISIIPPNS